MKATSFSNWTGSWKQGSGDISTDSATFKNVPYTFASRFEKAPGACPEELLAAAHAGCFNQALANNFGMIGKEAKSIETSVTIEFGHDVDGHPAINGSHIVVKAAAPGVTTEEFAHCAERARTNCTIAKALRFPITMDASLVD